MITWGSGTAVHLRASGVSHRRNGRPEHDASLMLPVRRGLPESCRRGGNRLGKDARECRRRRAGPSSGIAAATEAEASPSTSGKGVDDSDVLIEFRDVYKSFGSKHILRGVSFKIRRGEAVGIIGGSGSGKSTTLRLVAGLLTPDSGEILIKGVPRKGLVSDNPDQGLRIGLVFQSAALFDSLTVGENVGFQLYEHSDQPEHAIRREVTECLAKVGLHGVDDLLPAQLSGGMRKRVALARAICQDARAGSDQVIMYDEPTAGLDPVASTVVEDLMRSVHRRPAAGGGNGAVRSGGVTSYVVVTHQHSTIRRAVDRLVFLHDGKVAWSGRVGEFDETQEPIVRQFATGSLTGPISY